MRLHLSRAPELARFDPLAFAVLALLSFLALVEAAFEGAVADTVTALLVVVGMAALLVALAALPFGLVALAVWVLER